jgi:hypothetical protein
MPNHSSEGKANVRGGATGCRSAPPQQHFFICATKHDNHVVTVRAGGNCVEDFRGEVATAIWRIETPLQTRLSARWNDLVPHHSAIGEHGTLPALGFYLAFTSLRFSKTN